MAEFLGLGITHYPLLAVTDEHMADLLRWTLRDPGIPAADKDPANWPELMRGEWANDGGAGPGPAPVRPCRRWRQTWCWSGATTSTRPSATRSSRRFACWPTADARSTRS